MILSEIPSFQHVKELDSGHKPAGMTFLKTFARGSVLNGSICRAFYTFCVSYNVLCEGRGRGDNAAARVPCAVLAAVEPCVAEAVQAASVEEVVLGFRP